MAALMLEYPVRGRWLVQNSPANRALSHGTRLFDTAHSIDLVPVNDRGRTAAFTPVSIFRPEPAERLPGSGRPILAPIKGTIIAVYDVAPDHHAHLGFPSVGYALTQGRRATGGWRGLAGNHVIIQAADTAAPGFVALCHLRQDRVRVATGQQVQVGDQLGECGNSGNSNEPHLHLQAMETLDPERAAGLPITVPGGLPRNRQIVSVD